MYSDSNPRISKLVDWFVRTGGWLHPDVSIAQDPSGSYHVIAASDLDSRDYVSLARGHIRSTLSYLNLDQGQSIVPHINSPLQKCLGKIPNHVLTYLFLVEQLKVKAESFWEPYLACLPRPADMTTPLWFSDEDGAYMQGTPLMNSIAAQRDALQKEWSAARLVMAECSLAEEKIYEHCDFESYLWAVTIITSRAFISHAILPELPKFSLLFPVIDLLDHSPIAKAEWNFSVHDSFELKISQPGKAGTELLNNYGPKTNGELLYGYGFAIENNPVEQIHLKIRFNDTAQKALSQCCEPNVLPFGMDTKLCSPPFDSDVLIRPRNSPLGRYKNTVPTLGACPPQYVLSNYLAALHQRQMKPSSVQTPGSPGVRITLATIKPFYELVRRRQSGLPLISPVTEPAQNAKQRYAAIYRDSQAKLLHSLYSELNELFDNVRVAHRAPRQCIITTTEALLALKQEHPDDYENFKVGIQAGWPDFDVDEDIASLVESREEHLIWAILLVVLHAVSLRTNRGQSDTAGSPTGQIPTSIITGWLQDLQSQYPITAPDPEDLKDDDFTFIDQVLQSAAALEEEPWTGIASLSSREVVLAWALRVVRGEIIELPDLKHPEWDRHCLYMNTAGESEEWILRDVDVGDWRDVEIPRGS
ncbi:hypothetical protein B0J11DRAFT_576404 [Dendryphion nanum]|uniref:SET domain-containing protein n=1 Tax=Dendryphion nanum TaxID=256645 RepID=A0A9P9EE94_9PLEO|nr:hypothetical protein B0J11DRAFT_576404 [Dendryphion nanum]